MNRIAETYRENGLVKTIIKSVRHLVFANQIEEFILKFTKRPFVKTRYGVKMQSNWNDMTFRSCYFATYGQFYSSYLQEQNDPFIFLDIGSNQGLYTLIANSN